METITVKIKRQDDPEDLPYWEEFDVAYRPGMTVITLLNAISENPVTSDGNPAAPIAFESACAEGMCGACAMTINGRAGLACHTPVDELGSPILLEPLSKFPIVRDLKVDRSRMFDALSRLEAWVDMANAYDHGPALRIDPNLNRELIPFSRCVMCGACSEACPQVNSRSQFSGAFIFGLAYPLNLHPVGQFSASERLDSLTQRGGLADCAGAKACEAVCPKDIPLSEAIAKLGWDASVYSIKQLFQG